jgi:hypothetical protein
MKILLCAAALLLACHAARAGDPKAAPSPAKAGPVVDTKPAAAKGNAKPDADAKSANAYATRTKSVFSAPANAHNPFWPIGWVNVESSSSANAVAVVIPHSEDFRVSSILLSEPPMAVINGKGMAEGEIASLDVNGQSVMVQLIAVQDGRVIIRWQNQNLIVPLRRNEDLSTLVPNQPLAGPR